MASPVEICNMALVYLDVPVITTLTPPFTTAAQRYCSIFFDQAVNEILPKAPWIFARKRRSLTSYTVPAIYENLYNYSYVFPVDCARLLRLYPPDSECAIHYTVMRTETNDKIILCQVENVVAEYTVFVDDTTWFDPLFVKAVALNLASIIASPLRASEEKTQLAAERLRVALGEARATNKIQDYKKPNPRNSWIDARRRFY